MAPEVHMQAPYDISADFWSIAVTLYLFSHHYYPFEISPDDDLTNAFHKICTNELEFHESIEDFELVDLLSKMLNKNIYDRLFDFSMIKKHNYFKNTNFDWENL